MPAVTSGTGFGTGGRDIDQQQSGLQYHICIGGKNNAVGSADAGACRDQHINGQCLIYGELERGGGRLRGKTVYTDQFTEVINHRLTGKGDQILLCCLLYRNPDQHFAIGPQINQQTFCLCRVQRFAGIRFILRNHFCRDFVGIAFNKIGFCQRHSSS